MSNHRFIVWLKANFLIFLVLLSALALRLGVMLYYGWDLSINSDDGGYVRSAMTLLETGMLTYHAPNDTPTVHIMPGQPLFLALIFLLFGSGTVGMVAGKLIFIFLGVVNVYQVYVIGNYVGNKTIGLLTALALAFFLPQILTDNLFLTETPFMVCLLAMIYFSLQLADVRNWKYFFGLMISYILALMFKATIALFPFILLVYFILKKYPLRLGVKQCMVALALMVIVLSPWWIRNYLHYQEFIPLTGGAGNPLLLGTYQGDGAAYGKPYEETVQAISKQPDVTNAYEKMKAQAVAAKERMRIWWNDDKGSFLRTYLITKPKLQWDGQFYWVEIYSVTKPFMDRIHNHIVDLAMLSIWIIPFMRRNWREYVFLLSFIVYNTFFNSVYYAYDRYNQPLMFILFLFISTAVYLIGQAVRKSNFLINEKGIFKE